MHPKDHSVSESIHISRWNDAAILTLLEVLAKSLHIDGIVTMTFYSRDLKVLSFFVNKDATASPMLSETEWLSTVVDTTSDAG